MKPEKLYFENEDSEICYDISEHLFNAKCNELNEIEIIEAIPDKETKGYFWCMEKCCPVNSGECKKSYCSYYDPNNGKNGVCSFRGKLYKKGQKVTIPVTDNRFLLISLKWTNKNDSWFTFWRNNSNGYCWFKEWAGLYNIEESRKIHGRDNTIMVDGFLIKHLWKEIEYEGNKREVLPNTKEVRQELSIQLRDLKALHRTAFNRKSIG